MNDKKTELDLNAETDLSYEERQKLNMFKIANIMVKLQELASEKTRE